MPGRLTPAPFWTSSDRLEALGFGAVVKNLARAPSLVWTAQDEDATESKLVGTKSDDCGTRHRSAMAICAALDCIAFVVSQDGGVKAFKTQGDKVIVWPSVQLGLQAWLRTSEDFVRSRKKRPPLQ